MTHFAKLMVAGAMVPSVAVAQARGENQLGNRGQVTLAAERLFGFISTSSSDSDESFTNFSLFGAGGYEAIVAPYSIPRLAIDVFATDGFSLGIGANLAHFSRSGNSLTLFGLYPRLGYAVEITQSFSFWPRAGLSYLHVGNDDEFDDSAYALAGTLEGQFVLTIPHFGFMFGPIADIGFAGTDDEKVTQLGIQSGLIGWF